MSRVGSRLQTLSITDPVNASRATESVMNLWAQELLLHPMSVLEICRTIAVLYVQKLPKLFLLALLFFLPLSVGLYISLSQADPPSPVIILLIGTWVFATVGFYAVAAIVMSLAVENWHASMWQILRRLTGSVAVYLFLTVVAYWLMMLAVFVTSSLLVGLAAFAVKLDIGAAVLQIASFSLFFRIMISYCLAPAVVVLEGLSWNRALLRSTHLIAGHRWRTFSAILLFCLILVIFLIWLVPFGSNSAVQYLVWGSTMALFIGALVCLPIFFYFDVRCRKEAFHLETLREY